MNIKKWGNKGSFLDLFFILGGIFSFVIVFILAFMLLTMFFSSVITLPVADSYVTGLSIKILNIMSNLEWIFTFGFFTYIVASLYYASKVSTTKTAIVLYIIVLFAISFIGRFIRDGWELFISSDYNISLIVADLSVFPHLMNNITIIFFVYALAMLVALVYEAGDEPERLQFGGDFN